jgi:hypothetical protein
MFKVFNYNGESLELKENNKNYIVVLNTTYGRRFHKKTEYKFTSKENALKKYVELKNEYNMKPMNNAIKNIARRRKTWVE